MNRESIFLKIHAIFFLSVVSIIILFFVIYKIDLESNKNLHINRAIDIYKSIYLLKDSQNLKIIIESQSFEIVETIPLDAELVDRKIISSGYIELYLKNSEYFSKLGVDKDVVILKDRKKELSNSRYLVLIFGGLLTILIFSYFLLIQSFRPLKKLEKSIIEYGSGGDAINLESQKKDEISVVATELSKATKHIRELQEARRLFLRNVMHELKTPITKGKICISFLDEGENKKMLSSIFYRLENLIEEMASIESLNSKNVSPKIKEHRLIDIIENAIELLYLRKGEVDFDDITNETIRADFKFFSIVLKNLIDNGIKYSDNGNVEITMMDGKIAICSSGERLKRALKYYIEPFFKDSDNLNSGGFGLGLYIVSEILKIHSMELAYCYQEEKNRNCFLIV